MNLFIKNKFLNTKNNNMEKAFFQELKALIAKYDPTTGVAEQPVQEQKNLFPEPGIWVFESSGNDKWIIDFKGIESYRVRQARGRYCG